MGICHRDVKPENILYNHVNGQLKLIDFEIAKMAKYDHERIKMFTPTGTLVYKAPEMFEGEYNEAIDIWSVGVIAYEMAFGQLPFWSQYTHKLVKKIQEEDPKFNETLATPLFIRFMKDLLCKNPLERPNVT